MLSDLVSGWYICSICSNILWIWFNLLVRLKPNTYPCWKLWYSVTTLLWCSVILENLCVFALPLGVIAVMLCSLVFVPGHVFILANFLLCLCAHIHLQVYMLVFVELCASSKRVSIVFVKLHLFIFCYRVFFFAFPGCTLYCLASYSACALILLLWFVLNCLILAYVDLWHHINCWSTTSLTLPSALSFCIDECPCF